MTLEADLATIREVLHAKDIAFAQCFVEPPSSRSLLVTTLPPLEQDIAAKLRDLPRAQFVAGRIAARAAVQTIFSDCEAPIERSVGSRFPVFPGGLAGSITHTNEIALAVAAKHASYRSLGIDIENNDRAYHVALARRICGEGETLPDCTALEIFSMKEAAYKCCYGIDGVSRSLRELILQPQGGGRFSISIKPAIKLQILLFCGSEITCSVCLYA